MGYAQDTGYIPQTIADIMSYVMGKINEQFETTYTIETFEGTNFYKYFYAIAQRMQANEVKTSEIFIKMQDYFNDTNEKILRPKTTAPGIIETFAEAGYTASVKPPVVGDAGKSYVCIDTSNSDPDYADQKLEIATILMENTVGGVVTLGDESQDIVLENGQLFTYKFSLPDTTAVRLRLTIDISRNNTFTIDDDTTIKQNLLDNIAAKYALGKDFEPETYFTIIDAPWASDILLEYSLDGGSTWDDETYESEFDELFTFSLANVTLVQS